MLQRVSRSLAVAMALLVPAVAWAQAPAGTLTGVVRDSSGGAVPGANVRVINVASGTAIDAITDVEGSVPHATALRWPLSRGDVPSGLRGCRPRSHPRRESTRDHRRHADAVALVRSGDRHGAAHRGDRAGRADSRVGRRRETRRRRRGVQCQPPERTVADRSVLLDQSAQLRGQHSRARGAVWPHQ